MLMLQDYRVLQRDLLLEIARAITAQLELSEVLRMVLRASVGMLAGQVGLIALRNDSDGRFYIRATSGASLEIIPKLNEKLHDLMSSVSEGTDNDYLNLKLREMAILIDRKLRQSVAMPLIFADQPLGLLIVFRSYQAAVTSDDVQILQSFANQAAIAVHNAQLYERIEHERKRLAALLQHSGDGVMILSPSLIILRFNSALERMTGWSSQDAIGQHHDVVIVWQRREHGDLQASLAAGWPKRPVSEESFVDTLSVEGDLLRRDGLTLSIGITYAPLFDADGKLLNIIANVRDITNFRKAQEMQNVFISTVSHELRTPIALIKGYASTLQRDDVEWDKAVVREYLTIIEEEADRLTELVQDLLTASKIQAEQQVTLNMSDVRLDLLAMRAVERFRQTTNHHFELDFPDEFPVISADEVRLRQVIDNLVGNAIKYSPNGSQIKVGCSYDDDWVQLYVQDEGPGIPLSEQTRIFDRFYRIDNNLSRKTKGTGLGLYLAKKIIEAHRGTISVHSQPGSGARFTITLPR